MKQDVEAVNAWDFDRIITCHGVSTHSPDRSTYTYVTLFQNVIETGGKEAWKSAFENYL
jgi:hypothetical protein